MSKKRDRTFEPFLCMRKDCVYHQGRKIDELAEKRKQALSSESELVQKMGYTAAAEWYDAGKRPIKICRLRWITTDIDGYCKEYIDGNA
jgi:hypothetical protein